MSKSIKLSDNTYKELQDFCQKKETFSDGVKRLLTAYCDVMIAIMGQRRRE